MKEDCSILRGSLNIFDRLISVDNESIVHVPTNNVLKRLQNLLESSILLTVTYPVDIAIHTGTQHDEHRHCTGSLEQLNALVPNVGKFGVLNSNRLSKDNVNVGVSEDIHLNVLGSDLSAEERILARDKGDQHKETTFTEGEHSDHRLSNESESSLTWFSDSDFRDGSRNIKRGHSQVSGSSGNPSLNSDLPLLQKKDRMRRAKENKSVRPLLKAGSTDSPDRAELEPLNVRTSDSLSPVPHGRTEKINLSPQMCISKDSAVSIQDIMVEEQGSVPVQSGK